MKLFEFMDQQDFETAYYDPAEDTLKHIDIHDTRKPPLTLKILNKLKKLRALRKLEQMKRQDLLGVMYASPTDDMGMGGGFGGGLGGGGMDMGGGGGLGSM